MALAQLSATKAGKPDHRRSERRPPKCVTPIDAHVALRLKAARLSAGLSQEQGAAHIGLTFQQLQKYEKGTNRISAGKLDMLAELYGKPVSWFFDGAPVPGRPNTQPQPRDLVAEMLTAWHGPELMASYLAMKIEHQRAVADLAAGLAGKS